MNLAELFERASGGRVRGLHLAGQGNRATFDEVATLAEEAHGRPAVSDHETCGAISKAMLLLSQLDGRTPTSLSALVQHTSIPKSTVRRIMHTLCMHGMVRYTDTGYVLGSLAAALARKMTARLADPLMQFIVPHLLSLYGSTHGVICLGVQWRNEVVCVQTLHREVDIPLVRLLSQPAAVHLTSIGKALFSNDDVAYHAKGWLVALAMAINDRWNRPLAGIALVGPVGRFNLPNATRHLREAAYGASRAIRAYPSYG